MTMQLPASATSPVEALSEPRVGPQAGTGNRRELRQFATFSELFTTDDVEHIAANLRAVDKYECLAVGNVPGKNVGLYIEHSAISVMFYYRGRPTFIAGAILTDIPGAYVIWGFGTEETWRCLPLMTRVCRDHIAKYLFEERGARRLTVQLPAHPMCRGNINWLKRVGFIPEGYHPFATVDGEALLTLAVTRVDYENYVRSKAEGSRTAAIARGHSAATAGSSRKV